MAPGLVPPNWLRGKESGSVGGRDGARTPVDGASVLGLAPGTVPPNWLRVTPELDVQP